MTNATNEWAKPEDVFDHIDDNTQYLVKTNGGEWRDTDLFVWSGVLVKIKMDKRYVRGRPIFIAAINDPKI